MSCSFEAILLTLLLLKSVNSVENSYKHSFQCNDFDTKIDEDLFQKMVYTNMSSYLPYMLEINWNSDYGWKTPQFRSIHNLQIHPASKVINRALELFDSFEAVKDLNGKIRTFRIEDHLNKLANSTPALALPSFNSNDLIKCVKRFLRYNKFYMQSVNSRQRISVRSILIGTEDNVDIETTKEALLYVIGIKGRFQSTKPKPISIYVDPRYTRSWFGWIAKYKTSALYSSSFYLKKVAKSKGFDSILWLFNGSLITEGEHSNLFVVFNTSTGIRELVTPLANDLIYAGITRLTILELTKKWPDVRTVERDITIDEVFKASKTNRLLELFFTTSSEHTFPANTIHNSLTNETIFIPDYNQSIYSRINQYYIDLYTTNLGADSSWVQIFD